MLFLYIFLFKLIIYKNDNFHNSKYLKFKFKIKFENPNNMNKKIVSKTKNDYVIEGSEELDAPPSLDDGSTTVCYKNHRICYGGWDKYGVPTNNLYIESLDNNTWRYFASTLPARYYHTATVFGN